MGPLEGVRILELASVGPGPFAAMVLADLGADVVRVDRPEPVGRPAAGSRWDLLNRGRRSVAVDLKRAEGVEVVLRLVERSDALLEGFRPGVAERLGVGPEQCTTRKPDVVYVRVSGWGQTGPYSRMAGHDIDYVAMSGVLGLLGRPQGLPTPPLNLLADFGGGGMLAALGVCAALIEARRSGRGQVVDASMVDGVALLSTFVHAMRAGPGWGPRGTNILDSAAPFYEVYECADGKCVAVGAVEPQFYARLLALLGIDSADLPDQLDRDGWPATKELFARVFRSRTRDEWGAVFDGTDACVVPVVELEELDEHPQHRARRTFIDVEGVRQPAPAPRFSRTPGRVTRPPPWPGEHSDAVMREAGFSVNEIDVLRARGTIR
jgi:alpha-methylacyl-CoA racemase